MPFEVFLALRYLRSRRRRRLARVTAFVAMLGITIGVGALIVALALANGFRDEMRDKILRGTAHITVVRADGQSMRDHREVANRIKSISGVTGAFGTTYDGAVLVGRNGSGYAVLRGVDETDPNALTEIKSSLTQGSADEIANRSQRVDYPPAVVIGSELANRLRIKLGDVVEIIPAGSSLPATAVRVPVSRQVRVSGIFSSGLFEYDSTWIYMSLPLASEFAGSQTAASVVSVQLADIYQTKQVATQIRNTLGSHFSTIDWQDANRPLFTALSLERRMGAFIIALIIVIAVLNITTTLILVVVERRHDIGILSAMGASSNSIRGIFMLEGAIIGAIGGIFGALLGIVVCFVGNRYRLVNLPADVYSISHIPFHSQFRDVALAAFVAFVLSLLATIYPAHAAARMRPVEILRDTN